MMMATASPIPAAPPLHQLMLLATDRPSCLGFIPLHHCFLLAPFSGFFTHSSPRERAARALLSACPSAAAAVSNYHGLPLHGACYSDCVELVRLLLQLHPQGARAELDHSRQGQVPLYFARSDEVLHELLRVWPEGIRHRDVNGRVPLHCIAENRRHHVSAIEAAITAWPDGAGAFDDLGCTPMDRCLQLGDNLNNPTVIALLAARPQCFQERNAIGEVLLHRIDRVPNTPVASVKQVVLAVWPDAIRCQDNDGHVPLSTALRSYGNASIGVIKVLVEAWPEGARPFCDRIEAYCEMYGSQTADGTALLAMCAAWKRSASCEASPAA